jgi:hypothetical protein
VYEERRVSMKFISILPEHRREKSAAADAFSVKITIKNA